MSADNAIVKAGMKVAVVSCPALGDTTLFLRLAWRLQAAGAQVTLVSASLSSIREHLPGLEVRGDARPNLIELAEDNDLVICYIDWLIEATKTDTDLSRLGNVAYLAGKKLPANLALDKRPVVVAGREVRAAHNVICRDTKAGKSMVQWIDQYAEEVLGLDLLTPLPSFQFLPEVSDDASRRVAIFPTTPHANKNYSIKGFQRLGRNLVGKGWVVEFVGIPAEQQILQELYPEFMVHSFAELKGLVNFLRTCSVVVSNDSGGGHLASLMGLRTFTITRRRPDFTWRPGFNDMNRVVCPRFTFKWMGQTVWRPFIPLGQVLREFPNVAGQ
ncbi:ADP-heptose--LPS heptosyltransferase [Stutzerimonas stutzeri]|uniref:glycosyltransferase family 9 protein n=1 Tax=Stutzerimonas stutzeri TaxID=316 RepID=UPI00387DC38D